jgi:hypothetical protein
MTGLARDCQAWDKELAKSKAAIDDFQRQLDVKAAALADFEESLTSIEKDQVSFDRLISDFEASPPPAGGSDRDLLDDAKSLYQALDYHEAELARMRAGPRTHREFLFAMTDLQMRLEAARK